MINTETPYKLDEIIRDTWPNLYRPMNQTKKLNQIEYADYYSVYDKNGNKVCDSATLEDAILMTSLKQGRTYRQIKIIADQVVNVSSERMEDDKQLKSQNILPERQQEPFIV